MTAGLPGIGLSGLFALISGLFMPAVALWRRMFGARRAMGYKYGLCFVLAVVVAACAAVVWDSVSALIQFVSGRAQSAFRVFGLPTVVVSVIVLAAILLLAEGLLHAIGTTLKTESLSTSSTDISAELAPSKGSGHTVTDRAEDRQQQQSPA